MPNAIIVVPCYNEAKRLDGPAFLRFFASASEIRLLFVNDGSTDGTSAVLSELCASMDGRASSIDLPRNGGKAEAVRQGMLSALNSGAAFTGYYDADLATPPEEMVRLVRLLEESPVDVALASRVQLLGRRIERKAFRHYVGRIFATFASLILKMPVYDTQCGAKAFRAGPSLRHALETPFSSRWFFDVELIGRLHRGSPAVPPLPMEAFVEMPLLHWRDVPGSKLRPLDFPKSLLELVGIARSLANWEKRGPNGS